ncbi:MAG TPA: T9SS type A sorting domain-containing protein [Bacteroidales bacterium]|nr:T9SS type A sorting domain-containing protein [Bacteroidales bacterium]HSA43459.1 T9SS type A sorting domain-containing protein [Bacteroidales bacterium]
MKRSLIAACLICSLQFCVLAQSGRVLLVETFTNASCLSCAVQNPGLHSLLSEYPGRVVSVNYHVGWPAGDPFYSHSASDVNARAQFYRITGIPYCEMNGSSLTGDHYQGAPVNLKAEAIEKTLDLPSPLQITLDHQQTASGDSILIHVNIRALEAMQGDPAVFVAVVEKSVEYELPPGTNGEKRFSHVLKKLLPDPEGLSLPRVLNPEENIAYDFTWTPRGMNDLRQLCVVAWVQDRQSKIIHQAAFSPPKGPDLLNAAILQINKPGKQHCDNHLGPEVRIANLGGVPLRSLNIYYSVNGSPTRSYSWNGSLAFLESTSISLPKVKFDLHSTRNTLSVWCGQPNDQADAVPEDDAMVMHFDAGFTVGPQITIDLLTDAYPGETTWKIISSAGGIIAQGGPYAGAHTLYSHDITLPDEGCYDLVFYDAAGDGVHGKYGKGYVRIKDQNKQVFWEGGTFENEVMVPVKVDMSLGTKEQESIGDFQVFPNPFDNTATISLYLPTDQNITLRVLNEVGQTVYFMDKVLFTAGSHTIDLNGETWTPGIYFIKLFTGNTLLTKKLSLTK